MLTLSFTGGNVSIIMKLNQNTSSPGGSGSATAHDGQGRDEMTAVNQKRRFLSLMSHELRTPLNAILGFAELLNGRHFGDLNEKQLDYVGKIMDSGKHLLTLVNDLLDINAIDAGLMDVDREAVPVEECVNPAIDEIRTKCDEKKLNLNLEPVSRKSVVLADRRLVKRIMLNLLSNAVKYTEAGGGITVSASVVDGGFVEFSVSDTGIGVEPDHLETIFSDFEQEDRERDERLGGAGVGLALVKRLVESQDGRVWAESEVGKGSVFHFTLPTEAAVN